MEKDYTSDKVVGAVPVQRPTHLFEQIHEILWEQILSGEIQPGDRMKDIQWAKRLGVSRTPVREAMRKMQEEGILLPVSQGYQVRQFSSKDLRDLYRCRASLEAMATRDAAETGGAKNLKTLRLFIETSSDALKAGDIEKTIEYNKKFHDFLIESSDNKHLLDLCDRLRKLTIFYRSSLLQKVMSNEKTKADYIRHLEQVHREHLEILDCIEGGDSIAAHDLMLNHLLKSADSINVKL